MTIPTEPIGSIPRPPGLLAAMAGHERGEISDAALAATQDEAIRDTIRRLEDTGSPVVSDGEQSKPSFVTYPIAGLSDLAPGGIVIPFADGHQRQLPVLTGGPFRYQVHADTYLRAALGHAKAAVKQAVIAPSALSLLYPPADLDGYPRQAFLSDLIDEAETDIRGALEAGAHVAQLDFTEGRLSLKLDPSGGVLDSLIALNNQVLERFSDSERSRIGVHTCPGGDQDSTHSLDVDYAGLLPALFQLKAGNFYIQLASEADPEKVLAIVAEHLRRRPGLHRRYRPDRPAGRDPGAGPRPGPGGGQDPAAGADRHLRRLRLRAIRRRHLHLARYRVRQDRGAGRGYRPGGPAAGPVTWLAWWPAESLSVLRVRDGVGKAFQLRL